MISRNIHWIHLLVAASSQRSPVFEPFPMDATGRTPSLAPRPPWSRRYRQGRSWRWRGRSAVLSNIPCEQRFITNLPDRRSLLLFPVVQHFGQNPHIFDTPGLFKSCSQHDSVEPEVPPLDGPALHSPIGFLVEPTDSLGVCENLSGPDTRHHVWNVSLVMTTDVQMVRNILWLILSKRCT